MRWIRPREYSIRNMILAMGFFGIPPAQPDELKCFHEIALGQNIVPT